MRFNKREMTINICCFLILFYIFNISIVGKVFFKDEIATSILILSVVILILTGKIIRLRKYQLYVLLTIIVAIGMELFNNFYFKEGRPGNALKYTIMLFFPFIMVVNEQTVNSFFKFLKFFCVEHILGTMFVQFFKDAYINVLLPWMSNGIHWMAEENFLQGYNPGLTSHYSMNGMYLSFAIIYFFSQFLSKKEKKYIFWTFLAILAILFNAKRGPLIFSIMSCMVMYLFYNKEKMTNKIFKGSIILLLGIVSILIISSFVPQILNVVDRFEKAFETGNFLNGREDFYDLAKELWKDSILFGNGWGAFSYYFQEYLYDVGYGVEYLDAHNVYLQLLCETGLFGFLFYVVIMITSFVETIKSISQVNDSFNELQLYFSLGYQTFFILYCFSGNPLYDIQCYAIYFICIGISIKNYIYRKYMIKNGENNESRVNNIYTNI